MDTSILSKLNQISQQPKVIISLILTFIADCQLGIANGTLSAVEQPLLSQLASMRADAANGIPIAAVQGAQQSSVCSRTVHISILF